MKILSLNTWGGRVGVPLLDFLEHAGREMDVLCLQEVLDTPADVREESGYFLGFLRALRARLPDHEPHCAWMVDGDDPDGDVSSPVRFGLVTFARRTDPPDATRAVEICGPPPGGSHRRLALACTWESRSVTVVNVHGVPGGGKVDTPERLEQSQRIRSFLAELRTPWVLCGDLNLRPDTQSLALLEAGNARNLVRELRVPATRSSLYPKRAEMPLADYTIVSPGVSVRSFAVPDVEVSDHLPMLLEVDA